MKRITITGWLLCSAIVGAQAQELETRPWTMDDCMRYAAENSLKVRVERHQDDTYRAEYREAVADFFPTLGARIGGQLNYGRSIDPQTNTYNNISTFNNAYQAYASLPLFDGGQLINRAKAAAVKRRLGTHEVQRAQDEAALATMEAFANVLYYGGTVRLASEKLDESRRTLHKTRRMEELGLKGAADVAQVEAQVAADELSTVQATNDLRIATLTLTQLLELPSPEGFDVEPPTEADTTFLLARRPDDIYRTALTTRAAVRAEELRLQSSEKQVRVAQSALYPSLSFGASYSNAFYHIYNKPNTPFANQIRDNRGLGLGLNLRIPIFNRFATRNSIRSARLGLRNQELQLENTKKALYKDIQQAYYSALSAAERYRSATAAWQSAEKAFTFTGDRFENGRATTYEYNEAKTNLIKALSDRTQAKYEFLLRKKILEFYEQQ